MPVLTETILPEKKQQNLDFPLLYRNAETLMTALVIKSDSAVTFDKVGNIRNISKSTIDTVLSESSYWELLPNKSFITITQNLD